jgi:hypothetical protein
LARKSWAAATRLVSWWLDRDRVAALQGAIIGVPVFALLFFALVGVIGMFTGNMAFGEWLITNRWSQLLHFVLVLLVFPFLGALRGAFAVYPITSRIKAR